MCYRRLYYRLYNRAILVILNLNSHPIYCALTLLTKSRVTTVLTLSHLDLDVTLLAYLALAETVLSWHLHILFNPNIGLAKSTARLTAILPRAKVLCLVFGH